MTMTNRTPWYEKHKVNVPEGEIGEWRVEHTVVSPADESFGRMRATSGMGRFVPAGTYTMLYHGSSLGGSLWMSDTPDEIRDHLEPIYESMRLGGHVLINGLGIGMVANAVLSLENVTKVTIIENSPEVIALVGPSLKKRYGNRCEIIEADAYEYKPPRGIRYNMVWHDIWINLCTDNLEEMTKLHRKYGRRTDWQASWGKELLQSHRRRERNSGW